MIGAVAAVACCVSVDFNLLSFFENDYYLSNNKKVLMMNASNEIEKEREAPIERPFFGNCFLRCDYLIDGTNKRASVIYYVI